jgi:hypothetical protein
MNNLPDDFMEKNAGKYDEEDMGGEGVGGIQCCVLQRISVGS